LTPETFGMNGRNIERLDKHLQCLPTQSVIH
jgi:hypothetical protein